jgi:tRNA pseudouridine13 synthase
LRTIGDIPYLTERLAGTGGVLKAELDDFYVEERPLYEPEGEGEHVYVFIEKRGISTFQATEILAEICGVSSRSVAYAGLKDVKSVSRQWLSLPNVDESGLADVDLDRLKVLSVKRHRNKLRTGHLKGNFFRIRVREVEQSAVERAEEVLDILERRGVPNFYGPQRFGANGRNALFGRALVGNRYRRAIQAMFAATSAEEGTGVWEGRRFAWQGDYNRALKLLPQAFVPERNLAIGLRDSGAQIWGGEELSGGKYIRMMRRVPKRYLEFYVSALQAYLFNEVMKRRYLELDRVMEGDYAYIHEKGCVFLVEDAAAESARVESLEISPSGPIFGYKVPFAKGEPGEIEWGVLRGAHLRPRDFHLGKIGLKNKGVRRPMRVPVTELSFEGHTDGFTVAFFLPKGSFATTVLREVMKPRGWEGLH